MPDPGSRELPPLRDVIAQHGLNARRALGQNFLLDMNLTRRIARSAGDLAGATVIEVGPGPGGLTRALLETKARRVIAIERDTRCVEALAGLTAAYPKRLSVIQGDALEIDAATIWQEIPGPGPFDRTAVHIVSNLPYNIATPLLVNWLRQIRAFAGLTLMFQKEVADRLVARPRSGDYGRLSIIAQWLCEVTRLFDVSPKAFVPPPKVTSTVVHLRPRPAPLSPARFDVLETVTAAAFGQRRKMLRSALKSLSVPPDRLLAAAEVPPTARAEEIDVAGFCALARAYEALRESSTTRRGDA